MSKQKGKKARNAVIGQKPRGLFGFSSVATVALILNIFGLFFPDEAEAIGDRIKEALVDDWPMALQAIILIWLLWQIYRMWSRLEELSNLVRRHQQHLTALIGNDNREEA